MRILWLSHLIPYPPKGGVLQRAHHLLKGVAKHHDVDLLAFNQSDVMRSLFANEEDGVQQAREVLSEFCDTIEFSPIESLQNRHSKYFLALKSLFTTDPYNINWLKSPTFAQILQSRLAAEKYDLVHFDTISLVPYFKYINNNIPTVLDHHNIESHMLLRRGDNESHLLKKWYFKQEGNRLEKIENQFCPKFTLNITCSEIDGVRLKELAPDSWVEEVPNAVDTEYFKPDTSVAQQKSLLFIGSLGWYPNVQAVRFIANDLWPELKASVDDISIDIIGADPPDEIVQLSKADSAFRVHGFVDDIRPFFDKAALYICPITDGGGTKLKILDALSMQKAIIAHPIACEGIRVQDGRDVIFAQSTGEYIYSIKELLNDKERRRSIGEKASSLIEREYSREIVGEKLSGLFEDCLTVPRRT